MYPTYSTPAYNQTHHYNNLDYYNNDKLRYSSFYTPHPHPHHQPYNPYDIYHHAQPVQLPQTQTPPPNWNLFSPAAPSAVPVATPTVTTPPLSNSQSNNSTEPTLTNLSGLSEHMSPTAVSTPQPEKLDEPITQKSEPIGEITEINDNLDCFQDSQLGGVGIALEHGSVLIECAKHEMHATSSLKRPNRKNPTRITLIFYQHRNLNRYRHGIEEWEEKMRLKRLGIKLEVVDDAKIEAPATKGGNKSGKSKPKPKKSRSKSDAKEKKSDKIPDTIAAVIKEESNKFS